MMNKNIALLTLSLCLLTACHKQQDEKQILQAINAYHSNHPLCMALPPAIDNGVTHILGSETVRFLKTDADGKRINTNAIKQMTTLTKAGIYRKRKDEKNPEIGKKAWSAVYELTEKGAKFTTGEVGNRQLCLGSMTANKVQWYSEPTADQGLTVSRVSYQGTYHLHKWAKQLLHTSNPKLLENLSHSSDLQATVMKTNKGWIDVREVKQ